MAASDARPPMSYDAYVGLIQRLDELIAEFERHSDEGVREQVAVLLGGVDTLHREPLRRLVDRMRDLAGDEALRWAAEDPVVQALLGLYDIVELDLPEPESAVPGSEEIVGFVPRERLGWRRSGS